MAEHPYNEYLAIGSVQRGKSNITNYAEILDAYQLKYRSSEYYWQVGEPETACNWILNLSVIKNQLLELFAVIVPFLAEMGVPFKIIRDETLAQSALDGGLGAKYLGKIFCIRPYNTQDALTLAKELIVLTEHFKGPAIRTDQYLGGIVYTSLESQTSIPFSLPANTIWPFTQIVEVTAPHSPKLLNNRYYPISIIKPDAKGDVIKALYFKKFWNIKSCIIKQGRANMYMDAAGRDIRDRLKWQYDLHTLLAEEFPLPKIFDYFTLDEDKYLAMQFINGISFSTYLKQIYNDRIWYDLPPIVQSEVIDHLLTILTIIQHLHKNRFVHRDITAENFLLDKKNKIWLIDVELMWSANTEQPSPPFGLGTPGFISPEQYRMETPTEKEDIYALGGLLINFFTNLAPFKFHENSDGILKRSLIFFINDESIASMISDCFNIRPDERPKISSIIAGLISYKQEIQQGKTHAAQNHKNIETNLNFNEIHRTVQLSLQSLASPLTTDPKNRWISQMPSDSIVVGNEQLGMTVEQGWYRGVAGPLWLIALANRLGFDTSHCMPAYEANWQYIQKQYFSGKTFDPTLYMGGAGIALALSEALNAGMMPANKHYKECLSNCFSEKPLFPTLAEGMAGQGIAVLYASGWLESVDSAKLLSMCTEHLMVTQQADGSWALPSIVETGKSITALNHGIAGIIWFLLAYLQNKTDPEIKITTIKALNWLIEKYRKKGNLYVWSDLKWEYRWSMEKGAPGIALVLIKAYQVLGMDHYRTLAENILNKIPEKPVITNFTLGSGLAGIGELYLDAFKIFKDEKWRSRANWIAQTFIHTLHVKSHDIGYWLPDYQTGCTADLFMGNGGIIHFLMRCTLPQTLQHPLDPFYQL